MSYIVEYILNTPHEWAVWYTYGCGTKTGPMSDRGFLLMDERRKSGEIIIFSVEVRDERR